MLIYADNLLLIPLAYFFPVKQSLRLIVHSVRQYRFNLLNLNRYFHILAGEDLFLKNGMYMMRSNRPKLHAVVFC